MTVELSGAIAFVTGGGSGIGAGIAEALLEAGAKGPELPSFTTVDTGE